MAWGLCVALIITLITSYINMPHKLAVETSSRAYLSDIEGETYERET